MYSHFLEMERNLAHFRCGLERPASTDWVCRQLELYKWR
jgi:hypothetical protein